MCVNFRSAHRAALEAITGTDIQDDLYEPRDVWPRYSAPIIRRAPHDAGKRTLDLATFGLLPHWAREPKIPHSTMNARSETVASLPSFRDAWRKAQLCLVPMQRYFEPNYESGKAVRWSIGRADVEDFAVAGLWSWWAGRGDHEGRLSFTLLTVNCDAHPVLKRFHAPGDEKRSLVHLRPDEYDAWLDAGPELARSMMLELPSPEDLVVEPAPLPPRKKADAQADA